MDAVTYLKAKARICGANDLCGKCPLCNGTPTCRGSEINNPEKAIELAEKWLAEHPPVTYASKMREVYPKFDREDICLKLFDKTINCEGIQCHDCWNREYGSLEGDSK